MKITKSLLTATALACALVAAPAAATAVNWSLSGVTFDDGATATGSFTYDADSNTVSAWSISTSGGFQLSPFTYQTGQFAFGSSSDLFYVSSSFDRYLRFNTSAGLTNAGGTVSILNNGNSYECSNCGNVRYITDGSLVAGGVPEPAAWAMMLTGFGAIGFAMRRQNAASRVAYG